MVGSNRTGIISETMDYKINVHRAVKSSRITSNVTNFRVNITKTERSHKKHYEKCSWPGVV
jgi:hypothetical protein